MISFMWLIAIVVFLLLEAATFQFICIWFAGGALGSLVASMLGASLNVQMIVFFIVSALLLVLTRPFVKLISSFDTAPNMRENNRYKSTQSAISTPKSILLENSFIRKL